MSLVTHKTFHLVFILMIRVFETYDHSVILLIHFVFPSKLQRICKTLDHLEPREYSHSNILYF